MPEFIYKYHFKNTQMNRSTKLLQLLLLPAITLLFLISCEDYTDRLTGTNPPGNAVDVSNRITGFSPDVIGGGAELKVLGSNLAGVKQINMGDIWITDFNASDSEVSFIVPSNISLGNKEVALVFSGPERATKMIEVIPLPTISYFTPKAAGAGEEVTVTGNNLSFVASIGVGNVNATITTKENNRIKFTMPAGATTNTIKLTSTGGTETSTSQSIIACSSDPGNFACLAVINTNGSFEESNLGAANGVAGWGGLTGSLITGEITDAEYYDGFKSVKITINELGPNPWSIQPTAVMPVDPNATYRLSIWVKGTGIANVKFAMDQGGTPGWSEWAAPEVSLTSNQWTEITYEFSPTTEDPGAGGDATVRFAVSMSYAGNVGGVLYMDNLRVVKVE
jgi:hypothetical protein